MKDFKGPQEYWGWHDANGYSRFINANGTMTGLGGSVATAAVRQATSQAMGRFVKIHEIQCHASRVIAALTNSEAGCISASASAAISMAVAACMTGRDVARVQALPRETGPRFEVAIQLGHLCDYGAPVSTAVELTGATVKPVGQSTICTDYQLEAALTAQTAAALYVVSHHVVHYGQIPFERFVEIAHAKDVPVIVDAASEYDLTRFIAGGADAVIYSGHKFLGGPTSGIIAGRRELVRAAYMQNLGISRGMKVGKESIAGAIAAMEQWMRRDHAAVREMESRTLDMWLEAVSGLPGICAAKVDDPTGNPLQRLQIDVDPNLARATAATFARALGELEPGIIVRDHEVELGFFQLDPCNLMPGQSEIVAVALARLLRDGKSTPAKPNDLSAARNGGVESYLNWPG